MKVYAGMDPRLPFTDVGAHARRVEELGYDGLHVAETVHDSFLVALLALQATTRIVVRTSVTLAFVRSPTLTAYNAWDLSRLSGGRFELGLGTQIRQNIEDRFAMPYGEPVARLRDYVGALDALFDAFRTGAQIDYRSRHYTLTRLQPYFNPGPDASTREPPIWFGGVNAAMCELAGEVAAGFVTHPTNSSPLYLTTMCLPHIEAGLRRAGSDRSEFEIVAGVNVITGATDEELAAERQRQRRLFAFLYSTPAYRPTLALFGWEAMGPALRELIRAERWDDLASIVTDDVLETVSPSALHGDLPALIVNRYGGLVDGVLLAPPVDNHHDADFVHVIATLQRS